MNTGDKILSFYLGDCLYGLDTTVIKEIHYHTKYTPEPDAPPGISGLLSAREQVVTLFDLAGIMGHAQESSVPSAFVVLSCKTEYTDYMGFWVDRLGSVIDIDQNLEESPPAKMGNTENKFINRVVKLGDELLHLICWQEVVAVFVRKTGLHPLCRGEAAAARRGQELKGRRILVAEDSPINRQIIREVLESGGVVVATAANGKEAVQMVNEATIPYDAVLMDIDMPEMDGYEATRSIRRNTACAGLPIIAITAGDIEKNWKKGLAAGMNNYITKHFELNQLYEMLTESNGPLPSAGTEKNGAVADWPERFSGLDFQSTYKRLGGNWLLLRRLLCGFVDEHRMICAELREHLAKTKLDQARILTHRLKGVAGNIGAKMVFDAAAKLEMSLIREEQEQYAPLLRNLENALATLFASIVNIDKFLAGQQQPESLTAAAETELLTHEELMPLLAGLGELLQNNNMGAKKQLTLIKKHLRDARVQSVLRDLEDAMDVLDYKLAIVHLETIARVLKSSN